MPGQSLWNPKTYTRNDVPNAWLIAVALWGVLITVFGPALVLLAVMQALYAWTMFETVNYLRRYGLLRQKTAAGRYERCPPSIGWILRPSGDQPVSFNTCSGTANTTPIRLAAIRRCVTATAHPICRVGMCR